MRLRATRVRGFTINKKQQETKGIQRGLLYSAEVFLFYKLGTGWSG